MQQSHLAEPARSQGFSSGNETARYNFGDHPHDGADPYAGLIYVNGTLYGTTYYGGLRGKGTVFAIVASGKEKVLHSFRGEHEGDGANPIAGLINMNNTLYGTTYDGGAGGYGAVFSVAP
jgi:uncharacterized repeat protein (TIGR03803 family)